MASLTDHRLSPHPRDAAAWVPIRTLAARHRKRVLKHLIALDPSDRYLRFGYPATDAQIARYVEQMDFERDEVFGIFNRRLELIAIAHLACFADGATTPNTAEFGVSVLPQARGRGFGARLFAHAMLHARNRRIDTLIIHALSENLPMLRIAKKAGAELHRDGSEAEARLKLPPDDATSHLNQLVEDSAAEFDYQWKLQARRLYAWWRTWAGHGEPA